MGSTLEGMQFLHFPFTGVGSYLEGKKKRENDRVPFPEMVYIHVIKMFYGNMYTISKNYHRKSRFQSGIIFFIKSFKSSPYDHVVGGR